MRKVILVSILLCLMFESKAQYAIDWQNGDLEIDGVFGISLTKAYNELLKGKEAKRVIVAVIDSGIDTTHEDLKTVLWSGTNGAHGFNYLSKERGKEDVTNLARYKGEFYDSLSYSLIPEVYRADYQVHVKTNEALTYKQNGMEEFVKELKKSKDITERIKRKIGKDNISLSDLTNYKPTDGEETALLKMMIDRFANYSDFQTLEFNELDNLILLAEYHIQHGLNEQEVSDLSVTGMPYFSDNSDITPDALGLVSKINFTPWHGTHVAGIIGALRNNSKGMNGIADNVNIMMLKVVGNIRELRDENLASAIRYAVDNGAKIINMSFGKSYTWKKKEVDKAVEYAMRKDVLLVLAAGNEGQDLDKVPFYPNRISQSGEVAKAWLEVGASDARDDKGLFASFSNYGKKNVDVFAPGVQIYSAIPGSKYMYSDGTSMAAPVVSGLAALIRGYYPKLTAIEVKDIIMSSVVKRNVLADRCVAGGVINAYNALKLAGKH